jgi:hypothetical protein
VRAQVQHTRIVFEDRLRAIAVMHVEINDRHPRQSVHVDAMQRCDGDTVEQAEPHRRITCRMVSGWAHGAERTRGFPGQHGIHRRDRGTGGAQGGLGGIG